MWTRFRWWLAKKVCPEIHFTIRVGKHMSISRFVPVKLVHYDMALQESYQFDVERTYTPAQTIQNLAVDHLTVSEGEDPLTPEEHLAADPNWKPRSPEEMQALLRDALKGTPLEGMDEMPEKK